MVKQATIYEDDENGGYPECDLYTLDIGIGYSKDPSD
jgi:hypothetical protein